MRIVTSGTWSAVLIFHMTVAVGINPDPAAACGQCHHGNLVFPVVSPTPGALFGLREEFEVSLIGGLHHTNGSYVPFSCFLPIT